MLNAKTVVEQSFKIAFSDFMLVLHFDFQYHFILFLSISIKYN